MENDRCELDDVDAGFVGEVPARRLRLGVITASDRLDPSVLSGIPYSLVNALRPLVDTVEFIAIDGSEPDRAIGARRSFHARFADRLRHAACWPDGTPRLLDRWAPDWVERRLTTRAAERGLLLSARLARHPTSLDAVLSVFGSEPLSGLQTTLPILHFSDSTPELLNTGPLGYQPGRGPGFWHAAHEIERRALARASIVALASTTARQSAIEHYAVEPRRAIVAPMGATVLPPDPAAMRPLPPSTRDLRLCIVAADPVRKRAGLAVECTEHLVRMGWNARLTIIGRDHPSIPRARFVDHAGPLSLACPRDRARHQAILASSHLMLLPSAAEAWGIAPAEAAHFAKPSIVSDAGGLPEVVLHNHTGLVLPMASTALDYARAIDSLCRASARYTRLAEATLARARAEFTWERCAQRLLAALEARMGVIPASTATSPVDHTTRSRFRGSGGPPRSPTAAGSISRK